MDESPAGSQASSPSLFIPGKCHKQSTTFFLISSHLVDSFSFCSTVSTSPCVLSSAGTYSTIIKTPAPLRIKSITMVLPVTRLKFCLVTVMDTPKKIPFLRMSFITDITRAGIGSFPSFVGILLIPLNAQDGYDVPVFPEPVQSFSVNAQSISHRRHWQRRDFRRLRRGLFPAQKRRSRIRSTCWG